jgi:F-type H+-transporting ATPase subunit delta
MDETATNQDTLPQGEPALARPYAKAVFELARSTDNFQYWSDKLALIAAVSADPAMRRLLDNPRLTRAGAADLFVRVLDTDAGEQEANLIHMLAENGRLAQLPMIAAQFERLKAEAERTVDAEVMSAFPLSEEQKSAIADALKKRLGRDVKLNCSVNDALVGGAVIRAGDLVIDGSAVEHLRQLSRALVH